ncbi:MAG: hypothetical protein NVS4B4_17590 [Bradyrhizobium sp.]
MVASPEPAADFRQRSQRQRLRQIHRDHTTVLHAVRKIEALVSRDTALSEEVESLKRQLQE